MSEHPVTVQIITRDGSSRREVRREYVISTRHPRWELLKIFVDAFFHVRF